MQNPSTRPDQAKDFVKAHFYPAEPVQHANQVDISDPVTDEKHLIYQRQLHWKCDRRLIPILFLLFLCVFLDRINIGNAVIENLERDLHMYGTDFNVSLMVFYVFYIPLNIIMTISMRRCNPALFLGSSVFVCGVLTICQGLTRSWAGLVVCRLLLGAVEAGFFPGCIYLISSYYPRFRLQWRINLLLAAALMAGAFGGLLAYAISHMDGIYGYSAWRWIFIIEGIFTCAVAVPTFWIIPNWPEDAAFLTPSEREYILRTSLTAQTASDPPRFKQAAVRCLKDGMIWLRAVMYFCILVTSSSLAVFTPTILHNLGWVAQKAQYMSIPICLSAFVIATCVAFLADRLRHRATFVLIGCVLCIAGYAIMLGTSIESTTVRYFALYLIACGVVAAQPSILTWQANCTEGSVARGIGLAIQTGIGNCSGILVSYLFLPSQAPVYRTGFGIGLGFIVLMGVAAAFAMVYDKTRSRRTLKIEEQDGSLQNEPSQVKTEA